MNGVFSIKSITFGSLPQVQTYMDTQKTALTRLTRLCQTNPDNIKHLKQALSKNINVLAFSALEVSKETGNPIGDVLSACFSESSHLLNNDDIFIELSNLSVSLVDANVVITKNMLERISTDPSAHWQSIADFSSFYAQALLDKGEKERALQYAQRAACLYQRNNTPPSLDGLNTYSTYADILFSIEELQASTLVRSEIIAIYQSTGLHRLSEHCFDYADYLSSFSLSLTHLGQMEKAIELAKQAHQLTQTTLPLNQEDLYSQLTTKEILVVCYEKTGQIDLAVELLNECLKTTTDLYHYQKDNYVLSLIGTLKLFAEVEARRGNKQHALSYAKKSLNYAEKAYQQHSNAFYMQYIESLTTFANIHITFNKLNNAIDYLDKAINKVEVHAPTNIDAIAVVLNNRITIYLEMLAYDDALNDAYRILLLYRHNPNFKADLALAFKTIADCYLGNNDLFRALRNIKNSIARFQVLLTQDKHYVIDLLFARSSLSAIQQKMGEYALSLETSEKVIKLLEQDNNLLKQANLSLYYTIAITQLYNFIALKKEKKAFTLSTDLIESARNTFIDSGKQFAELLTIHAGLLQDKNKDQQALPYLLEACNIYRHFAPQAIHYQFELASVLNDLCYLQSILNHTEQAFITIEESLQIYNEVEIPSNYEILGDYSTALLHYIGLLIENKHQKPAIANLKILLLIQQEQLEDFDRNIIENDPEFLLKLQQSGVLLKALGYFSEQESMQKSLKKLLKIVNKNNRLQLLKDKIKNYFFI